MKKYFILLLCTFGIITTFSSLKVSTENIETFAKTIDTIDKPLEEIKDYYIAKNLNDFIAIYSPSEDEPFLLTDINIKTLQPLDQELLNSGIILDESYPLNQFLEDFSN